MAHLRTQQTRRDPESRLDSKMRLVRMLYQRGFDAERVRKLFRAMDLMMALPERLEAEFDQELVRYEEERQMSVQTPFERRAEKRGRQAGVADVLLRQLERRFGTVDEDTRAKVAGADNKTLMRWADQFVTASRLEDVFA